MKFRFEAVDQGGTVMRGVMRADSEEEAREILYGEAIHPKSVEPAGEEAKVDWAPADRVKDRLEEHRRRAMGAGKVEMAEEEPGVETTCVTGYGKAVSGRLGLSTANKVIFVPEGDEEPVTFGRDNVEVVRFIGFPKRLLQIVRLDARMYEFTAGFVFSSGTVKKIVRRVFGK